MQGLTYRKAETGSVASRTHQFHRNPFTRTAMSTLTTQDGTCWTYRKHNGRVAFEHKAFVIHFEPQTGFFHLKEKEETVFVAKTPWEVLEEAAVAMLEHYASKFKPCWE